mgnify:CR=1 FL=1
MIPPGRARWKSENPASNGIPLDKTGGICKPTRDNATSFRQSVTETESCQFAELVLDSSLSLDPRLAASDTPPSRFLELISMLVCFVFVVSHKLFTGNGGFQTRLNVFIVIQQVA